VLAGDCAFAPALLALGASGMISASAHVSTASFAELVRAWRAGDARTAQPLGHRLAILGARLFAEPNPVVIKAVLAELGHIPSATVRLPLVAARPASVGAALTAMAAVGPEALATV
jgi:4-hydroxy-tetrahydrodipicolinate synthase